MPEVKWNTELYNLQHNFVYKFGENVIEWLDPQVGEKILDVGCGTGQLADIIRHAGALVTGIDASPEMVERAKENYDDIEFFVRDACDFSFDEKFDAAFSNAALHWISNQREALRCIYDALKQQGRFVFEMGGRHNIENIHCAITSVMKEEGLKVPRNTFYFPSVAEQCRLLEQVGFTVSDVMYFKRPTKLEGEDGMRLWIGQFCGFFFENVSDELRERVTAKAIQRLRYTNYGNGVSADYVRLRIKAIKD